MTGFNAICSFSQDASSFAFQPANQKDIINIYPLDANNSYKLNTTLVKTIDYERDDLSLDDIEGVFWITEKSDTGVKRKSDGQAVSSGNSSNLSVFVNCFSKGKLVFYENNQIVNIIKNKNDIIGMKPFGKCVWILDSEDTVKHFAYNSTKPIKTFHLIDGKDQDIFFFDVLKVDEDKCHLAVVTETQVIIIDPSKRRPVTLETIDVFGCVGIKAIGGKYVIADLNSIKVFENGKVVREWAIESEKLDIWGNDKIVATSTSGSLCIFDINSDAPVSTISVENSEIIDSVAVDSEKLIVAWLNVNEPQFVAIEKDSLVKDMVVSNKQDTTADQANVEEEDQVLEDVPAKVTKKDKKDIFVSLINAFNENEKMEKVIEIIESDKWNEAMIKSFVAQEVNKTNCIKIYESLTKHVSQNPWNSHHNCSIFLKWILMLFNVHVSKKVSSSITKTNKNMKHSLATTSSTLPLLLSIQGKVEMLIAQAELRKEMSEVTLDEEEPGHETLPGDNDDEDDDEENIHYVDGEENDEYEEA